MHHNFLIPSDFYEKFCNAYKSTMKIKTPENNPIEPLRRHDPRKPPILTRRP